MSWEVEITCPRCKQPMVRADNVSPSDQIESGEYEKPCRRCVEDAEVLDKLARDVKAQKYLTEQMVKRFQNSPTERFRRWAHNALHAAQFTMGHKFCFACNMLTHNRLEPHQIDHVRPASHDGVMS